MQARKFIVASAIVSTSLLGLAAPAHALCDAYSGTCATPPPGGGDGEPIDGGTDQPGSGVETPRPDQESPTGSNGGPTGSNPDNVATPASLPFTGGEIALLTALGAGALAGGAALVVAGRRRDETA